MLCERNCCLPVLTEGITATACSFQVFVLLVPEYYNSEQEQNAVNMNGLLPLQTDTHCWLFHEINTQFCTLTRGTALPNNPKGSLWQDTENQRPHRAAAAIRKEQSLQELPDVAPVHTHGGHLGAAVLVEFVATRLTPKAIEQELLADVTEGKLQKCLPSLENTASD